MTEPVDVVRLRKMVLATERYAHHRPFSEYDGEVRREELDEIMRMLDDLIAERGALKASCIDHMNTIGELTQDVEKLEAEVERLREVLRRIAATHSSAECEMDGYGKVWHGIDCPQKLAIDGLGEREKV